MATQRDVAERAGVSFITVSRVLNNSGYVSEKTRTKIMAAIKELNYYPDHIGQALKTKKVNTIGIIIPEPPDMPVHAMEYYNRILQGVDRATDSRGYDIIYASSTQNDPSVDYLRLFFQHKADGLILFIPDIRYLNTDNIVKNKIPCVIVGERPDNELVSYVDAESYKGMYTLTDKMIHRGIRSFAYISGKPYMKCTQERLKGFSDALTDNDLSIDSVLVFDGDYTFPSGQKAMEKILRLPDMPNGIICASDMMALGIMDIAKKAGKRIPEDFSLAGYDDMTIAEFTDPSLCTVNQPLFEMGAKATEILFSLMENPDTEPSRIILPTEVIIRNSIK